MWVLSLSLLLSGLCNYSSGCPTCPRHYCCWSKHNKAVSQTSSLQPSRLQGLVRRGGSRSVGVDFRVPGGCWSRPTRLITTSIMESVNVWWGRLVLGKDGEQLRIILERKKRLSNLDSHMNSVQACWNVLFLTLLFESSNALYFRSSEYTFVSPCV